MTDTLKITRIGAIPMGVDGQDLYLKLEDHEADMTAERVDDFFMANYYADTTKEAGGFFCRYYNWLQSEDSDNFGVLIVYQRFDV